MRLTDSDTIGGWYTFYSRSTASYDPAERRLGVGPGPDHLLEGHKTERGDLAFGRFSAWLKSLGWDRKKKSHGFRKIFNTLCRQQAGAQAARQVLGHDSNRVNTDHHTDERYTLLSVKILGT